LSIPWEIGISNARHFEVLSAQSMEAAVRACATESPQGSAMRKLALADEPIEPAHRAALPRHTFMRTWLGAWARPDRLPRPGFKARRTNAAAGLIRVLAGRYPAVRRLAGDD